MGEFTVRFKDQMKENCDDRQLEGVSEVLCKKQWHPQSPNLARSPRQWKIQGSNLQGIQRIIVGVNAVSKETFEISGKPLKAQNATVPSIADTLPGRPHMQLNLLEQ